MQPVKNNPVQTMQSVKIVYPVQMMQPVKIVYPVQMVQPVQAYLVPMTTAPMPTAQEIRSTYNMLAMCKESVQDVLKRIDADHEGAIRLLCCVWIFNNTQIRDLRIQKPLNTFFEDNVGIRECTDMLNDWDAMQTLGKFHAPTTAGLS